MIYNFNTSVPLLLLALFCPFFWWLP